MVSEINLDSITPDSNGEVPKAQFATDFAPMRRKLQILDA